MEKYAESEKHFNQCLELNPHHPYATNNLAYALILLKQYKNADEVCARCFSENSLANNYFRNWAVALIHLNNFQDSVDQIKRAIDIDPRNASKSLVIMQKIGSFGQRS